MINTSPYHLKPKLQAIWKVQVQRYEDAQQKLPIDGLDIIFAICNLVHSMIEDEDVGGDIKVNAQLKSYHEYLRKYHPITTDEKNHDLC